MIKSNLYRWIAAYVNEILKSKSNWFLITDDGSYVILGNLMLNLLNISNEVPAYSFISDVSLLTV